MNCRKTRSLLSGYHDRELKEEVWAAVDAHLNVCPACAREYRQFKLGIKILKKIKTLKMPEPGRS